MNGRFLLALKKEKTTVKKTGAKKGRKKNAVKEVIPVEEYLLITILNI